MVSKNSFSALSSLRGLSVAPGSVFLGPWAGIDHEKFLIVAGTVIPVHRHPGTSEDVAILRGKAEEVFYDSEGHEVSRCLLSPGGDVPAVHVPMGQSRSRIPNIPRKARSCSETNLNNMIFFPQINCRIEKKLYLCHRIY